MSLGKAPTRKRPLSTAALGQALRPALNYSMDVVDWSFPEIRGPDIDPPSSSPLANKDTHKRPHNFQTQPYLSWPNFPMQL